MIGLYLIACHFVGDFVLQTRWQAANKLTSGRARFEHVLGYTVPFVILAIAVGDGPLQFYGFPAAVAALHFATDSRRFHSGLVEHVAYRLSPLDDRHALWRAYLEPPPTPPGGMPMLPTPTIAATPPDFATRMPPNPWPPLPILIDQTLHLVQLALLAGLMLR